MAVGRALKGARLTHKGPGDDPADFVLSAQQLPGDLANAVQLIKGNDFLVGGDLEDAVAGGIDDRLVRCAYVPRLIRRE